MQKTKSLLVKILVLMMAICCAVSCAFGLVGCAKDGANGKDGVGVVSATVNAEGKLVITLSNGETILLAQLLAKTAKMAKTVQT
jgi:hypothetical protein